MKRPDLIRWTIDWMLANDASMTEEIALRYEQEAREEWGGQEVRIWKTTSGRPGRPPGQPYDAAALRADGLTNAPTESVTSKHGVSRATLYRLLKRD